MSERTVKVRVPYSIGDEIEDDTADLSIEIEDAVVGVLAQHEIDVEVRVEWVGEKR